MHNLAIISVDDLKVFVSEQAIKNEVWDTKKAAKYLDVSVETVKKQARNKEIPAVKIGSDWKFSSIALYRFVACLD